MKRTILILSVLVLLTGCEKTYKCTIKTPGIETPYVYELKGTRQDAKDFEDQAIMGQSIKCK